MWLSMVPCPQRDSNPCFRLERAASSATGRWGLFPQRSGPEGSRQSIAAGTSALSGPVGAWASGFEAVADPDVRVGMRFDDVADTLAREEETARWKPPDPDHPMRTVEPCDEDREPHPERVHGTASSEHHDPIEWQPVSTPKAAHPLTTGRRDLETPPNVPSTDEAGLHVSDRIDGR